MSGSNPIYITNIDLNRISAMLDKMPSVAEELKKLEQELDRAIVLEPEAMPDNVVRMNSTVDFKFTGDEKVLTRTLVYPQDLKTGNDISIFAPVGSALIGLSVGEKLDWPMPNKQTKTIEILNVTF
ncbi:nucleoside diphosphate kinase regulator [Vibrio sp. B1FLJ16]|uniref:nucleoside diphosphate kinase regulator n=1 Tax=Vibrio sp. B1FLJ16 TaxID=2751178 RepID=UPI0015F3C222|nr:nucleoside diphosphate kinase regulator [Vibrio sp. B1FLJ16]CAD7819742.1 Rnk N-terminus [Vibrio sp. B1FLJ16]CAD7820835.1 Rnk N-terminus [Vibrio sp. B1FLJ16]CAE6940360.1 Rnk N-terminus [Vibrio sp. B1FLJ16]CAE6944419.1 Rnk N-terminus [Vibrio sp. B1FLJ16]